MKKYVDDGTTGTINSAQAKWIRRTGIPGLRRLVHHQGDGRWRSDHRPASHDRSFAAISWATPSRRTCWRTPSTTIITDPDFKGPWGIPDREGGTTDVEGAAHGFVRFKSGQVLSLQVSWAEMVKREEVSVVFQGTKAGGKVERLFGRDGFDETAIDTCELYVQENGNSVDRTIIVEECEDMGRINSAANFIDTINGVAEPLNTPDQAHKLMLIIDALYESARSGAPVAV